MKRAMLIPHRNAGVYLLILSPSKELSRQIWSIKYDFAAKHNVDSSQLTGPHITLIRFAAHPKWEAAILNQLRLIGRNSAPINVHLQNYGSFETSRTIFINVVSKDPIRCLLQELKQAKHLLGLNTGVETYFSNEPHLTVCKGLNPLQYTTGWSDYATRRFAGSFTAAGMTLLKEAWGANRSHTVEQFAFESTPVLSRQGCLFV